MPTRFNPKLRRTARERKALWRNQVTSLFKHERIKTTLPKAKALMRVVDEMITYGKRGTLRDYRQAAAYIREPMMLRKCFTELASRYKFRPGGYSRVVRTFNRRVDHAPMAYIELVDRAGEFRAAKAVNYLTAVEKKLVPPPLAPIVTARDLKVASMISPSTSNRVSLHRPHWRKLHPDHLIYYADWSRRTVRVPLYMMRFRKNLENQKIYRDKLAVKYGKEVTEKAFKDKQEARFKLIRKQVQKGMI